MNSGTWATVLRAAGTGGTVREIAGRAGVSPSTARRYLQEQDARGEVTRYRISDGVTRYRRR